jgi:hypothetical protein
MSKYIYWLFIFWSIIILILAFSGYIVFGHGLGDVLYYLIIIVFLIIVTILRTILLKKWNSKYKFIIIILIALFVTYITVKATVLRGPEYPWNGRMFKVYTANNQ